MKRLLIACAVALAVPAAPAVVAAPAPRADATHAHKCAACGHVWHHTDASRGNAADHTCPKCNTLLPHPWHKYTGPTPAAMPAAPLTYAELHARVLAGEAGTLYVGVPAGSPGGLVARVDSLAGFAAGVYRCRRDAAGDAVMSLLAPAPAPQPVRNLIRQFTPFGPACPTGRCPLTR